MHSGEDRLAAEKAELDVVLASGILGRGNYAVKLLTFVCEKYFSDQSADVKEYSIAVQALGRSADFDPQADTIVRVTAHSLRKRLEEYYRTEGAEHEIHICILPADMYPPLCLLVPCMSKHAMVLMARILMLSLARQTEAIFMPTICLPLTVGTLVQRKY